MGPYQLSLQATYPGTRTGSGKGSGKKLGSKRGMPLSEVHGYGYCQSKRLASYHSLDSLFQPSPPRHSTACCDGLSERRELEKRFNSQRASGILFLDSDSTAGQSFRSEDSESLALWEEKEQPVSSEQSWMKVTAQSPRWRDAMKKFESLRLASWRSSPIHPKSNSTADSPPVDKRVSTRSSSESSRTWYSHATKILRTGDSKAVRSPPEPSKLSRKYISGELNSSSVPSSKWEDLVLSSKDSKSKSFSLMGNLHSITDKNARFTASAVAWDISLKPERIVEKPRIVTGVAWEIPLHEVAIGTDQAGEESTPISNDSESNSGDESSTKSMLRYSVSCPLNLDDGPDPSKNSHSETDGNLVQNDLEDHQRFVSHSVKKSMLMKKKSHSMDDSLLCRCFCTEETGQQLHTDRVTSLEGRLKDSDRLPHNVELSEQKVSARLSDGRQTSGNDSVSPSFEQFSGPERRDSSVLARIKREGGVPFEWEDVPGKPKLDETAAIEIQSFLRSPPRLAIPSSKQELSLDETLRANYMSKSISAPLGLFYKIPPNKSPLFHSVITKRKDVAQPSTGIGVSGSAMTIDSLLMKSKSTNDAKSPFRTFSGGVDNMTTSRLIKKLRTKVFGSAHSAVQGKSSFGVSTGPPSPRSVLCGPDSSQPSSNPSLRSDFAAATVSATPTCASQSIPSSRASFDSNEHYCDVRSPTYNQTTAVDVCKLADSRRISLSFRDFGPSRPSGEDGAGPGKDVGAEMSAEDVTLRIELRRIDNLSDKTEAQSKMISTENPELWVPTLAPRNQGYEAPRPSLEPNSPDVTVARDYDFAECSPSPALNSLPVSRLPYVMFTKEEHQVALAGATKPRLSDFSARLGGLFSPLRLISKCDGGSASNYRDTCLVPASSPTRSGEIVKRSAAYRATSELLSPVETSPSKKRKSNAEKARVRASRLQPASVEIPGQSPIMATISKAVRRILSKCTVRRSTSKRKGENSKYPHHLDKTLPPANFNSASRTDSHKKSSYME